MKLWDHRSRPRLQDVRRLGYAVNMLNRGRVPVSMSNMGIAFWAELRFARGAFVDDMLPAPNVGAGDWRPSFQKPRGQFDVYGLSGSQLFQIHSRVMFLRYLGRGGFGNPSLTGNTSDHGFGYTNFSVENVTHGDFTLSGDDHRVLEGACAIDGTWCYFDDPWQGVTWNWATNYPDRRPELDPAAPEYEPNMYGNYSGPGAIDWNQWSYQKAPALYILNEDDSIQYNGWGASPTNPSADAWNNIIVPEDGFYQKYPVTMPSLDPGMFGNYVGCRAFDYGPSGPDGMLVFEHGSMISGFAQGIEFPDLLKRIDSGATIVEAWLIYRASGLKRVKGVGQQEWDGEKFVASSEITESLDSVSWILLGKKTVAGNTGFRSYDLDVLGHSLPSTAGNDEWRSANVTELMQAFVNTYRGDSPHHMFGFIPAPFAGEEFVGAGDARSVLRGLLPDDKWTIWLNPDYVLPVGYSGPPIYYPGCGDVEYCYEVTAERVEWDSLEFREMGVVFRLPDGTLARKCYPFNMVRTD